MELHEQVVRGGAAVHAQFTQGLRRIRLHGAEQLGTLEGDRLQRGTGDVRAVSATRKTDEQATRLGIPVRATQARECRNTVDAAAVRHAGG